MVETGTILQNRYLIEKQIGEGGMGAVYLAVDQKFDSRVAIKETFYQEEDLGEAFEREARLLNNLHHPVLPHVSDYFIENGRHFLLMEFIEGEDLSDILLREGAFPVQDVLRWTDELLDALDYLHSHEPPIIHRDIKPSNLKLTPRGNIVLLDFGLAKLESTGTLGVKSVFGYSRRYSPLEQIQGTGTDSRSDIFSLGATIYHLLSGKPPIDVLARAASIVAGKLDPLQLVSEINSKISIPVAQVIQTALALNSDRRFNSAKAMRKALEYAVNLALINSVAEPTEVAVVVDDSESGISSVAENDNFPALEAFVAENIEKDDKDAVPVLIEIPVADQPEPAQEVQPRLKVKAKGVTLNKGNKKSLLAAAACLVLLLSGIFAFLKFTNQTKSTTEINPSPVVKTNQPLDKADQEQKQNQNISDSATPDVSLLPQNRNVARTKVRQPTKTELVIEPQKTIIPATSLQTEKIEKSVKHQNQSPAARPIQAKTRRRPVQQPVAIEQPPVSSIETILTGLSSDRQRRESTKQQPQINEDKKNDVQRRREDNQRHNRKPN